MRSGTANPECKPIPSRTVSNSSGQGSHRNLGGQVISGVLPPSLWLQPKAGVRSIKLRLDNGSLWWEHFRPGFSGSAQPAQAASHPNSFTCSLESAKGLAKAGSPRHPCHKEASSVMVKSIKSDTGRSIGTTPFTHHVFMDVSTRGWGAHLDDVTGQGRWTREVSRLHINCLEMRAVRLALSHFHLPPQSHPGCYGHYHRGCLINKVGGTRSWSLWRETESLFAITVHLGISVCARFIPGKMNVIADDLSRAGQILPTEWSLHQDMALHVFNIWEQPNFDLFVTQYNTKCPTFVSATPDARALDMDALTMDWEGLFAFCPSVLLSVSRGGTNSDHWSLGPILDLWTPRVNTTRHI